MTPPAVHRALWCAVLAPLMWACRKADAGAPAGDQPDARLEGGALVLRADSARLATFATAPAAATAGDSVTLNGRLVWDEDVTVRVFSPFAGRVVRVLADAGRTVAAGDALAEIASPDFGQAQADARRASADLALSERTLARQRDLMQHGVVAQKDVDAAEADLARARAEQQRTEARLRLYGGDTTSVNQVFRLAAPIGGVIVERNITPGQEVRPDQMLANAPQLFAPLFVVTDPGRLWVMLDVPERDLPRVHPGSPLAVRPLAAPDRAALGRVMLIAGALDPATRTIRVRGEVSSDGGRLRAEMLVSVTVPGTAMGALAVPSGAVVLVGDAHVVFVEERSGRYRRREVKVGAERGGMVTVLDGLSAGERVVTTGSLLLEQLFQGADRS